MGAVEFRQLGGRDAQKGIQIQFCRKISVDHDTISDFTSKGYSEERSYDGTDTRITNEKSSRKGDKRRFTRVLQPFFCGPQAREGEVETNFRFEHTEQFHFKRKIQDGNCRDNKKSAKSRGIRCFDRSVGCISPHTHKRKLQEISEISCGGCVVPIQSPSNGSDRLCSSIHKSVQRSEGTFTAPDHTVKSIPGRLDSSRYGEREGTGECGVFSELGGVVGVYGQSQQVRTVPEANIHFPRIPLFSRGRGRTPNAGQVAKDTEGDSTFPEQRSSESQGVAVPSGSASSYREEYLLACSV